MYMFIITKQNFFLQQHKKIVLGRVKKISKLVIIILKLMNGDCETDVR